MSKLIVSANSKRHLNSLLKKDIDGVILSLDKLSVNDSFYVNVSEIEKINFGNLEVFISLNKLMHNSDLPYLEEVMSKLKDMNVKILFYDMAVYNIAKRLNMVSKLVIYQDHLNASSLSNRFYFDLGINTSYITSDITEEELLEIKKNSKMKIMFLCYGYVPIFYSRRYLVKNYLKYINEKNGNDYKIISDTGITYPIVEEEYGTTIYSSKEVNLINYLDKLSNIDYLIMRSNMIDDDSFNLMVDKYIRHESIDDAYIGFFNMKTIYKVK